MTELEMLEKSIENAASSHYRYSKSLHELLNSVHSLNEYEIRKIRRRVEDETEIFFGGYAQTLINPT